MADDTILIRARAAVAGMRPGEIDHRPAERAQALIDGGYAVRVDSLGERVASEPPNRHLDRVPSNQSGGTFGGEESLLPPEEILGPVDSDEG